MFQIKDESKINAMCEQTIPNRCFWTTFPLKLKSLVEKQQRCGKIKIRASLKGDDWRSECVISEKLSAINAAKRQEVILPQRGQQIFYSMLLFPDVLSNICCRGTKATHEGDEKISFLDRLCFVLLVFQVQWFLNIFSLSACALDFHLCIFYLALSSGHF